MNAWQSVMRPELLDFAGYSAASEERDLVRLHANELPVDADGNSAGLNRYPLPQPARLVEAMAQYYGVRAKQVLPVRGSDDAIDLLVRSFCRAGRDAVLVCPPTFGMYEIAARLQDAGCVRVPLLRDDGFRIDRDAILARCNDRRVRIVFLCSPNNPTGNVCNDNGVLELASALAGRAIAVVDEAYIEFAGKPSVSRHIDNAPNLVVLRTLSKALGLAGIRCGALIGPDALVARLRCLMPPYPLPVPTIDAACQRLAAVARGELEHQVVEMRERRERLAAALRAHPSVRTVWPSDANFLLVQPVGDARAWEGACRRAGILVRYLPAAAGLPACLRITIGTQAEIDTLMASLPTTNETADA